MLLKKARQQYLSRLEGLYGPSEARAITQLLFEHFLGESWKYGDGEEVIPEEKAKQLESALHRLLAREPAQYVIGEAWFCGLRFHVDRSVLIPRPETEELVEWIISGCRFPVNRLRVLDVGTGSGCIAITLKRRIRKAEVHALELSAEALGVARFNASSLGASVGFHQGDFLGTMDLPGPFDILVSNPPYIPENMRDSLAEEVREFEPPGALFVASSNPFVFYEALAEKGLTLLNPGGSIYAEFHQGAEAGVDRIFTQRGYVTTLNRDMQGNWRMIRARKRG